MKFLKGWKSLWLTVPYTPCPEYRPFLERLAVCQDDDLCVETAVLDDRESDTFFGVPLARRGIQPVWLRIANRSDQPFWLRLASIDPNYYPPLEAAYSSHFRIGRQLLEFGLLALVFVHLLILLPFKLWSAHRANRRMDAFFQDQGIGWGAIHPGEVHEGFIFTTLDEGTKQFSVKLFGTKQGKDYAFSIPVRGLRVDHHSRQLSEAEITGEMVVCDEANVRSLIEAMPRSTVNRVGKREGDPLNLVVIGRFETVLSGFGARWDETETISLQSCWRTLMAFSLGRPYRYSPVSALFFQGRSQDFALQKIRQSINERMHLRLWLTPLRFDGLPVWVGQVSRDIGVRFTPKTWNLTTHKIDPDVDDARDFVLDYLVEGGHVDRVGYVDGAGAAPSTSPRHNLTGDPYFTDGRRAVVVFSETRALPKILNWT